jgi:hypothetical protein
MRIIKLAKRNPDQTDKAITKNKNDVDKLQKEMKEIKKDIKSLQSEMKKANQMFKDLNVGNRLIWQQKSIFTSLQRKIERFEKMEKEWESFKKKGKK